MLKKGGVVRLVDGFKIRNTLDIDFGVLHTSSTMACYFSPKFFIPRGEHWLDHRFKAEYDFLVKLMDYSFPAHIKTYTEERAYLKKMFCPGATIPSFRLSMEKDEDLTIVMVAGNVVRTHIDPEFIFGGHDLVYAYVPAGEIWLDASMDPAEIPYVLWHEKAERALMGAGRSYDVAHEHASAAEKELRREKGVASYAGDEKFPYRGLSNKKLAEHFYLD